MPPITSEQFKSIPSALKSLWDAVLSPGKVYNVSPWKIRGPESTFNRALSILNYPAHYPVLGATSVMDVTLAGWYHRKEKGSDWFMLDVSDDLSVNLPFNLVRFESQDLVDTFGDEAATNQRFNIKTRCSDGCKVTFSSPSEVLFTVPIKNPQKYMAHGNVTQTIDYIRVENGSMVNGDATLAFNYIHVENVKPDSESARSKFSLKVRAFFNQVYNTLLPTLVVTGLLAFVLSCYIAIKEAAYEVILGIAGTCWIAIVARAAILVLVDISSFPAVNVLYLQPIFALSIIASILSIGAAIYYLSNESSIEHNLI